MIKKVFITLLLLLNCSVTSAMGLRFVGMTDDGTSFYIDKGSISYFSIFDEKRPENNRIAGCYYELIFIKNGEKTGAEIVQSFDEKGRLIARNLFINAWIDGEKHRCFIDAPDWQLVNTNDPIQQKILATIAENLESYKK